MVGGVVSEDYPRFVLAWVTVEGEQTTPMGEGGQVLFVEHPERGWEIPGGHLENRETPEKARWRELEEETGLSGKLVAWNRAYYPEGWVGHVRVPPTASLAWSVDDKKVASVRWWSTTPPVIAWTEQEFEDLARLFSS